MLSRGTTSRYPSRKRLAVGRVLDVRGDRATKYAYVLPNIWSTVCGVPHVFKDLHSPPTLCPPPTKGGPFAPKREDFKTVRSLNVGCAKPKSVGNSFRYIFEADCAGELPYQADFPELRHTRGIKQDFPGLLPPNKHPNNHLLTFRVAQHRFEWRDMSFCCFRCL